MKTNDLYICHCAGRERYAVADQIWVEKAFHRLRYAKYSNTTIVIPEKTIVKCAAPLLLRRVLHLAEPLTSY